MSAAPASLAMFLPFDPAGPAAQAGLYDVLRELRETAPVVRGPAGVQAVLTHREVTSVLRDERFGWGAADTVASHFGRDENGEEVRQFIFMDPPDHTRIRSLVTKAFSARLIERMRPRAEEILTDLLRDVEIKAADGPVDLIPAVTQPLQARLLGELMGVPDDNLEQFQVWTQAISRGLDPDMLLTPEQIAERDGARARFNEYFGELAARRRVEPADDLVSALVKVEAQGDRLRQVDLVTTCTLLLGAGYATTSNLIANSLLALLTNPEQMAVFRAEREQTAPMVEELHRFDPPVQMISRTALVDADVAGYPVVAGEPVLLMICAANHDPAVYTDPDRLDLTRRSDKHLGFGLGIHFCVGAPLSRLTAQVALRMLADRDLALAGPEPAFAENLVMRGPEELQVTVR